MAGKFGPFCTEFPPGNIFGKKLNRTVFETFPAKKLCSISYRNSVEFSIFLVPLTFLSVCKFLLQDAVYIQDKLRNITWQVLKWKYLAKKRFFVAKNLSILFPFLENSFHLTHALNNFTCSQFYFVLCCKNAYCLPC